jgi:hypothetical protein
MRTCWLWVSNDKSWIDAGGKKRWIRPGEVAPDDDWWNCDPETKAEDLVLIYRTAPVKAIVALVEATSEPRPRPSRSHAPFDGSLMNPGEPECEWKGIAHFARPLTIDEMNRDPALKEWPPLRGKFRRRVFRIESDDWSALITRLDRDNPGIAELAAARIAGE